MKSLIYVYLFVYFESACVCVHISHQMSDRANFLFIFHSVTRRTKHHSRLIADEHIETGTYFAHIIAGSVTSTARIGTNYRLEDNEL